MNPRPAHRPFRGDTEGVSAVIGGILVLSLFVSLLVTVRVNYVPVWDARDEAEHMRLVQRQLASLTSDLDQSLDNASLLASSHPVSLEVESGSLFSSRKPDHRLEFDPDAGSVTVSSPRMSVQREGSQTFDANNESWSRIPTTGAARIEDVSGVDRFRIRLASVVPDNDLDRVVVNVTNHAGAFAGEITIQVVRFSGGFAIDVRVRNASAGIIFDQGESHLSAEVLTPYWVDVLRPDYRFADVLNVASAPYDLAMTVTNVPDPGADDDLVPDYAITYRQETASGSVVHGGGQVRDNYSSTTSTGILAYRSQNTRYVNQDYVLEAGGLVLEQPELGRLFKIDPPFRAGQVGNYTSIDLSLPSLVGESSTLGGVGTAHVRTDVVETTDLVAQAPSFTFSLTTDYPDLWSAFWVDALAGVDGFVQETHYLVNTTASTATLTVYGRISSPSSLAYDLFLTIRFSDIEIALEA